MEALINLIMQFGDLNKQQIEFLLSKVEMLEFKKDDYLSEAGKVPRYVAFVLEGVFRFCYYNNKGEEITNYFVDEGNFVVDNQKFESQIVASEYVQARLQSAGFQQKELGPDIRHHCGMGNDEGQHGKKVPYAGHGTAQSAGFSRRHHALSVIH
jgi:hypothetical protein